MNDAAFDEGVDPELTGHDRNVVLAAPVAHDGLARITRTVLAPARSVIKESVRPSTM